MRVPAFLAVFLLVAVGLWFGAQRLEREDASATGDARPRAVPAGRAQLDGRAAEAQRTLAVEESTPEQSEEPAPWPAHLPTAGGIVLELVDPEGKPQAGRNLVVDLELWRLLGHEHEDKYQEQAVVTDPLGRAPIAARWPEEIECVSLPHAPQKDLRARGPFECVPAAAGLVRIVLPARVTLHGRVLDFAGKPADPFAFVTLDPQHVSLEEPGHHTFTDERKDLRTDAEGRFTFEVFPGWFTLSGRQVGEEQFEILTLHVAPTPREITVDLRVPSLEREVRVLLTSSRPIAPHDPVITARAQGEWPAAKNEGPVVARMQEPFLFRATRDGDTWLLKVARGPAYEVSVSCKSFVTERAGLPPDAEEIAFALVPEPEPEAEPDLIVLSGRATDTRGNRLQGQISLLRSRDLVHIDQTATDSDGGFVFKRRPQEGNARSAFLFGRFRGTGSAGLGAVAIDRSRDDLDLVVGPALDLGGRIEGLHDPEGAEVMLFSTQDRFARPEHAASPDVFATHSLEGEIYRTGSEGTFLFSNLPAGNYGLWIQPVSGRQPPARVTARAGTEDLRILLGAGLEGDVAFDCTVVDAFTRRPIADAEVWVIGTREGPRAKGSRGRTGVDGRCELRGHAAGRWFLDAHSVDHARGVERYVEYGPGRHVVEIALSPRCDLDVELVDASGAPVAVVEITATTLGGIPLDFADRYGNWDGRFARTNVAGRARLSGLPAGKLRVVALWSRGRRVEVESQEDAWSPANPLELTVFEATVAPERGPVVRQVLR